MTLARRARRLSAAAALLLLLPGCSTSARWREPVPEAPALDAARVAADVAWLADDAREGRGLGTRGLAEAAAWLAERFREAGLEPGAADGSYFQRFWMPVGIRIARARLAAGGRPLARGTDFEALFASDDGRLDTELVFAGYGITDPETGYDDYAGVDVRGRAVLVLDERPRLADGPLGGARGAAFLLRAYKLLNARRHGAALVLLAPSADDVQGPPAGARAPNPTLAAAGILALAVSRPAAARLLDAAPGPDLAAAQQAIDAEGRPASRLLSGARIEAEVQVERELGEVSNVIAVRPGADPAVAHEAVVVGAHYDHLGLGAFASLAPGRRGEVHNGADDNASGSAGLLALARAFGAAPAPRRSLVLAAFTAEEAGLVGSSEYVAAPPVPLSDTVAMVNLDMIGRLREGRVTVFGTESARRLPSLVEQAVSASQLEAVFEAGAAGPSDQTRFATAGVPVVFFFTGVHPDYHTPDDDAARVDAAGEARVLEAVYRVTRALLDARERPTFARAAAARPRDADEGTPGYGPYLGTIPAFGGPAVRGVRLQGVSADSPAERAGLRAGDVIVGFDGAPVRSLEEYAALLFIARAGSAVELEVERDGERFVTRAVLGQRR